MNPPLCGATAAMLVACPDPQVDREHTRSEAPALPAYAPQTLADCLSAEPAQSLAVTCFRKPSRKGEHAPVTGSLATCIEVSSWLQGWGECRCTKQQAPLYVCGAVHSKSEGYLASNIATISALVLDVDALPQPLDDLITEIHAVGCECLIHETCSSTPSQRCVRLIFPFTTPVDFARYRAAEPRLAAFVGGAIGVQPDPKVYGKPWFFVGAQPHDGAPRRVERVACRALDFERLVAVAPQLVEPVSAPSAAAIEALSAQRAQPVESVQQPRVSTFQNFNEALRSHADAVATACPGERNETLLKVTRYLGQHCVTSAQEHAVREAMNDACRANGLFAAGKAEADKTRSTITRALKWAKAHPALVGWGGDFPFPRATMLAWAKEKCGECDELNASGKRMLVVIAKAASVVSAWACISYDTLATRSNVSRRHVPRVIRKLEYLGLIEVVHGPPRRVIIGESSWGILNECNKYRLIMAAK